MFISDTFDKIFSLRLVPWSRELFVCNVIIVDPAEFYRIRWILDEKSIRCSFKDNITLSYILFKDEIMSDGCDIHNVFISKILFLQHYYFWQFSQINVWSYLILNQYSRHHTWAIFKSINLHSMWDLCESMCKMSSLDIIGKSNFESCIISISF